MVDLLAMPLRPAKAQSLLHEWAQETKQIVFTAHVRQQMRDRRITTSQVLKCLRFGLITEGPSLTLKGGWKVDVQAQSSGDILCVAAELKMDEKIIVITAYMR